MYQVRYKYGLFGSKAGTKTMVFVWASALTLAVCGFA